MLKRIAFIFLILFCAPFAHADVDEFLGSSTVDEYIGISTADEVLGQTVAGGSNNCPSGTYTVAWNGDHGSGNLYLCDSGEATNAGSATISSSYGDTGNGVLIADTNDQLVAAITFNNVGTIWWKVDPQYCGSADGNHFHVALGSGVDTFDIIYLRHRSNGNLYVYYRWDADGAGSQVDYNPGTWSCSAGTFEYLAISWDNTQSDGSDKLAIWYDGSWSSDETLTLGTGFEYTIDELQFQSDPIDQAFTDDTYYLDNVAYIAGTYQAANPW
jgi:hypothetical protein